MFNTSDWLDCFYYNNLVHGIDKEKHPITEVATAGLGSQLFLDRTAAALTRLALGKIWPLNVKYFTGNPFAEKGPHIIGGTSSNNTFIGFDLRATGDDFYSSSDFSHYNIPVLRLPIDPAYLGVPEMLHRLDLEARGLTEDPDDQGDPKAALLPLHPDTFLDRYWERKGFRPVLTGILVKRAGAIFTEFEKFAGDRFEPGKKYLKGLKNMYGPTLAAPGIPLPPPGSTFPQTPPPSQYR